MMHKAWYCLGAVLYWFSRSSVKFQGYTAKKNRRFRHQLGISGLYLQFQITDGYEMMHKDWRSIEEVPYCFSRLCVKFQGHRAKKILTLTQNWDFSDCNSSSNSQIAMKWCSNLAVAWKRCPIVFQGHPWNFKVTRDKYRWFWVELSVSGLSLQFEFSNGFEMIYKAWSIIEEVPYCLSMSSIKFQGHTRQKIVKIDPNWAFLDCNCGLNSPMGLKWCTKLDVVQKRCPTVLRGHPSNLEVTWTKKSMIWIQF